MGKVIWHVAKKTDNPWVKQVHTMYTKDQNQQEQKAPVYAGWALKNMCKKTYNMTHNLGNALLNHSEFSVAQMYSKLVEPKSNFALV